MLKEAYAHANESINKVLEKEKAAEKEAAQKAQDDVEAQQTTINIAPSTSSSSSNAPQIIVENPPLVKTKGTCNPP